MIIRNGRPYIIAEISANHNQRYQDAERLVMGAKLAGADAVKLQTYTPDTLTINSNRRLFIHGRESIWKGRSLYSLFSKAYMPWDWQIKLFSLAKRVGIDIFSTPFCLEAVDFLEKINTPAYKIGSYELTDIPLISKVAQTQKPIFLSTGMGTEEEIDEAITTIKNNGRSKIIIMKCTTAYPAKIEDMNLLTIPYLKEKYNMDVGLSDHSIGPVASIVSASLGATVFEKHIKLPFTSGPDSVFSMCVKEFGEMVRNIHDAFKSFGKVNKSFIQAEREDRKLRRSLYAVENIKKNEIITSKNIRSIRPADGLHTSWYEKILGWYATKDIKSGTPLTIEMVDWGI
jgi:pseudaminic acid synthase